jgi:hypothetical protein
LANPKTHSPFHISPPLSAFSPNRRTLTLTFEVDAAAPPPQKLMKMNDSLLQWFGYKIGEVGFAVIKRKKNGWKSEISYFSFKISI